MPIRVRPALVAVTTCLLVTSGCASLTAGSGSGSGARRRAPRRTRSPRPSTSPPSTTSRAAVHRHRTVDADASSGASGCAAAYCDDFSSTKSGWDVGNEKHFYSQYDSYLGGTFRMGERHDAILTVPAPYDITKASSDYSVQVDAEAILGPKSPKDAIYGLSCWNHEAHNKSTSAFVFSFTRSGAQIVLWDNTDGSTHTLKKMSWSGVVRPRRTATRFGRCACSARATAARMPSSGCRSTAGSWPSSIRRAGRASRGRPATGSG